MHIAQPQLDQLAPAQPGLDRGLDEQLSGRGPQGRVQPVELLRRQDAVLLDLPVEVVAVALPGARLEDVVREPHVVDVGLEAHAAATWVVGSTGRVGGLHLLPGPVGIPAGGERAGGPLPALRVQVVGGVAGAPVVADPLAAESHRPPP